MKYSLNSLVRAMFSACLNGLFALGLMLLVEFSISGSVEAYGWYFYAAIATGLFFFCLNLYQGRRRPAAPKAPIVDPNVR